MRPSIPFASAILAASVGFACGQPPPSAPSRVPVAAAGATATAVIVPQSPGGPPIEPQLARLNLVINHLVSANHQLTLYLSPSPPPIIPPSPVHLQNALDFYLKANDVLGQVAVPGSPPIAPQWADALNAIIGQANSTIEMLNSDCTACGPSPPPIFQDIAAQAFQTKSLATALAPSSPPI